MIYPCPICGWETTQMNQMVIHLIQQHGYSELLAKATASSIAGYTHNPVLPGDQSPQDASNVSPYSINPFQGFTNSDPGNLIPQQLKTALMWAIGLAIALPVLSFGRHVGRMKFGGTSYKRSDDRGYKKQSAFSRFWNFDLAGKERASFRNKWKYSNKRLEGGKPTKLEHDFMKSKYSKFSDFMKSKEPWWKSYNTETTKFLRDKRGIYGHVRYQSDKAGSYTNHYRGKVK